MQITSLFQPLRLPKLSKKAWITPKELTKFTKTVTWVTKQTKHSEALLILTKRISTLWKRSGPDFTFLYLKEVMRLIIRSLSGNPEPKYLNGVMVKRDHNGLPTIVPSTLRKSLKDYRDNQRTVVCILSIISVYRVFPTKVKPKLGTITDPFDGITRTIDSSAIKLALAEITRGFSFKLSPPTLLKLETAGPNAVKSAWGASIDALAFVDHPITFYHYIRYMVAQKRYAFIAWVVLIVIVSSPIFIVLRVGGWLKRLNMGKLSVVYDQAGKARVVAITNWWIQVALKPLHKTIFKLLKGIEEDGTFDQLKPFNKLILNEDLEGVKFHSFDLSAATDRLPIDLQRDILNLIIPNLGTLWANLLAFEWSFKKEWRERAHVVLRKTLKVKWIPRNSLISVRYAVGQPMGAYSSWAMLALTHHVLVRVSAHRAGLHDFKDYCILGDDVVIRNDAVSNEYFNLMKSLGVSINLSKSVNSFEFAEFAKVWKGPNVNITPIGPGLTLRFIRDKKYLAMYIFEAWKLSLFYHFSEVLALVKDLRSIKNYRPEVDNLLWSSFGLNGFTFECERNANVLLDKTIAFCFSTLGIASSTLEYRLCNTLLGMAFDDNREAKDKLLVNEEFFYLNWWKTFSTRSWPLRLLEAVLKVLGPGFWVYSLSFEESEKSIEEHTLELTRMRYSWQTILKLVESDPKLNLSSIDWTNKKLIKDNSRRMRKLVNSIGAFSVKSFYEKSILIKSNKPRAF